MDLLKYLTIFLIITAIGVLYDKYSHLIIDEKKIASSIDGMFGYTELKGDMMSVTVGIEYENTKVIAKIREENGYPLMFIESIDKTNDTAERNG